MELINMYETGTGEECKRYLEKLVGSENEGRGVIWGHKHLVMVEDVDIFHQIVQATKNSELRNFQGVLSFIVDIPIGEETLPEHFRIYLDANVTHAFLNKYGKQYKIN